MRRATESDLPAIAVLATLAGGSGWWGWEQRTGPVHPDRRRWVEVDGDEVVGYGCVWRRREGIFGLDALVHPAWRKHGLGQRICDRLFEDLAEYGATAVEARIDADHRDALRFMVERGFHELNRLERLRLDLEGAAVDERGPDGIEIATLSERRDDGTAGAVHRLLSAAFAERPVRYLDPFVERPVAELTTELERAPADGCFVARADGEVVGFSGLTAGPEPQTLAAFVTAVAPTHRHRGIAQALKRRTIAFAKRGGYRAIFSSSPNPDMQELNEMLGFRRCAAAEIRMARRLKS